MYITIKYITYIIQWYSLISFDVYILEIYDKMIHKYKNKYLYNVIDHSFDT